MNLMNFASVKLKCMKRGDIVSIVNPSTKEIWKKRVIAVHHCNVVDRRCEHSFNCGTFLVIGISDAANTLYHNMSYENACHEYDAYMQTHKYFCKEDCIAEIDSIDFKYLVGICGANIDSWCRRSEEVDVKNLF